MKKCYDFFHGQDTSPTQRYRTLQVATLANCRISSSPSFRGTTDESGSISAAQIGLSLSSIPVKRIAKRAEMTRI
jgi:hypothetical protein